MWRQKSRVQWLKEGDRNSRFFHVVANGRRRNSLISELSFNRILSSNPQSIRKGVFDHFKKHFQKVSWQRPTIKRWNIRRLTSTEREMLEEDFSEEIWEALNICDGDKAPGPGGLNLNFVKENWEVIQKDFMIFAQEFQKSGSFVKEINHTFIALIPKI